MWWVIQSTRATHDLPGEDLSPSYPKCNDDPKRNV